MLTKQWTTVKEICKHFLQKLVFTFQIVMSLRVQALMRLAKGKLGLLHEHSGFKHSDSAAARQQCDGAAAVRRRGSSATARQQCDGAAVPVYLTACLVQHLTVN
jgi:hypothetical protein